MEARLRHRGRDEEARHRRAARRLPARRPTRLESGAVVDISNWGNPKLEPEIVARAGEKGEITAIGAAIELIDLDPSVGDPEEILERNIFQRHVLLGPVTEGASADDVSLHGHVDGEEVAASDEVTEATGELDGLVKHVAKTLKAAGAELERGDMVICGSIVPALDIEPGDDGRGPPRAARLAHRLLRVSVTARSTAQRLEPAPAALALGAVVDLLAVAEPVAVPARAGDVVDVAPGPAVDDPAPVVDGDRVVARAAVDRVAAVRAVDEVVAVAAVDQVALARRLAGAVVVAPQDVRAGRGRCSASEPWWPSSSSERSRCRRSGRTRPSLALLELAVDGRPLVVRGAVGARLAGDVARERRRDDEGGPRGR